MSTRACLSQAAAHRDAGSGGGCVPGRWRRLSGGTTRDRRRAARGSAARRTAQTERRIDALMRRMTLREKLDQLTLLSDGQMKEHPEEARRPIGAVFSETDPALINKYQHDAVENSRLHIPILFAFDTIHGFRTIFPIPLGTASSFDPSVAQTDHRIGAFESAAVGLKQIYSPMVDVSHEPRWGRISEASRRGPVPQLRDGGRARAGRAGQRLQPRRTRSSRASSTTSPTASPRPAATTTRPTCRTAGCGTSTCRRSRRRSTPAPTPRCARSTRSTACRLREQVHGDADPQAAMGLRRIHRERLHRRRRAAAMPGREPGRRPVRPRRGRGRPRRRAPGAQRRHGLRDGVDELPRLRAAARAERSRVDAAASTTRCAASCA